MDIKVEVIYPYEAQETDELDLAVGDIITHVEYLEKGWCKGVLNNETGAFPDNFVRTIHRNRKMKGEPRPTPEAAPSPSPLGLLELAGRRFRVAFSYQPQHEDELALNEGDLITVMQKVEEGWWKGVLNGKVGMFPSNFVEPINNTTPLRSGGDPDPSFVNANTSELNGNSATHTPELQSPTVNGAPLQDSPPPYNSAFAPVPNHKEADGPDDVGKMAVRGSGPDTRWKSSGHTLPTVPGSKPSKVVPAPSDKQTPPKGDPDSIEGNMNKKMARRPSPPSPANVKGSSPPSTTTSPYQSSPPVLPPKPVRELARALFPYKAEHEDELDLQEGDVVTVLCKELEDRGWWRGEMNGRVGVFPDNFVLLITTPPPAQDDQTKPPRPDKPPNPKPAVTSPSEVISDSVCVSASKDKEAPPPPLPSKKQIRAPVALDKKLRVPGPEPTSSDHPAVSIPGEDGGSLSIGRETHLSHLTRPKGPSNRRPPSQILRSKKRSFGDEEEDGPSPEALTQELAGVLKDPTVNEASSPPPRAPPPSLPNGGVLPLMPTSDPSGSPPSEESSPNPPWLQELKMNQKKRLSGLFTPPNPPAAREESPPPPLPHSSPPVPKKPSPITAKPQSLARTGPLSPGGPVPHHRREGFEAAKARFKLSPTAPGSDPPLEKVGGAPTASVTPLEEKMDALFKEVMNKVKALEDQTAQHLRQIQILTKDLDSERKLRACLEIEVDRLSKLIVTTYAQV